MRFRAGTAGLESLLQCKPAVWPRTVPLSSYITSPQQTQPHASFRLFHSPCPLPSDSPSCLCSWPPVCPSLLPPLHFLTLQISAALPLKHRLNEASKRSARWKAFHKMQFLNSGMKSPQGGVCQGSRDITNTAEASSAHEPRTLESSVTPPETKHGGKRYELQLLK